MYYKLKSAQEPHFETNVLLDLKLKCELFFLKKISRTCLRFFDKQS